MGLLDRFRRKEIKVSLGPVTTITDLEKFLADDKETYEALRNVMFLDPRKAETTSKEAAEKAKKAEKDGKRPEIVTQLYEIAGSLSIYEGDAGNVAEYFGRCQKLSPKNVYPILKNPEKAVAKAKEYYDKYLK